MFSTKKQFRSSAVNVSPHSCFEKISFFSSWVRVSSFADFSRVSQSVGQGVRV